MIRGRFKSLRIEKKPSRSQVALSAFSFYAVFKEQSVLLAPFTELRHSLSRGRVGVIKI